ncbi:hypothetical protein MANAM107_25360 [Actinomyces capricornis]|uniref:Uncharacterized protein n=1 Tax=Actinomyces capricornis TaxID=2755559 RepID=A0ABN6K7R7_9ACTO|nr:hypothetical protein MANAM107_25360 [Actinomyces capricornis]
MPGASASLAGRMVIMAPVSTWSNPEWHLLNTERRSRTGADNHNDASIDISIEFQEWEQVTIDGGSGSKKSRRSDPCAP